MRIARTIHKLANILIEVLPTDRVWIYAYHEKIRVLHVLFFIEELGVKNI